MVKRLTLSLLFSIPFSIFSMIQLDNKTFKSEKHLKNINVFHKDDQIFIQQGKKDPVLVNMLGKSLKKGTSLKIKQLKEGKSYLNVEEVNGQYRIELKNKLKGGGLFGAAAGVWLGAFLVNSVCYGTIGVVSGAIFCFCPPLGVAVGSGLCATLTAPIQVLATTGAIAGGVIGGVATGPI